MRKHRHVFGWIRQQSQWYRACKTCDLTYIVKLLELYPNTHPSYMVKVAK